MPCPDHRRVFAYLQKRGIAPQVIQGFESGLLYEDALHHNCVFVGRDSSGKAEREAAASLRDTSVAEIAASPDAFTRYLNMQGDNPTYSAGNIAMVMEQNPAATVVFTRDRWKAKGRSVLETEQDKGSKIFVRTSTGRGYTLADAFDVSQTQGQDIRTPHLEDNTSEMDLKYELTEHPAIRYTIDGGGERCPCHFRLQERTVISPPI